MLTLTALIVFLDDLPDDPNMPALEEIVYSEDDEEVGAEADMNNLETNIPTRRMTKKLDEHALVARIQEGIKHKDFQNCLFACFLSQVEPKKTLMDLPKGKRAIGTKWVYRNKKDERGIMQSDPEFPDKGYKVKKALYGLHQAPRAWYETLSTYLLENRFKRGTIDKTLFIKDKIDILLVQVYVDDIIFGSTKKCLQVKQKEDGIFISQDKYMDDILNKFDFSTVKKASIPMETNKALIKDVEADDVNVHLYRSMIRSLMYLATSRPDIMFVIYDSPLDMEAYSDRDYAGASLDRKSITGGYQFLRRGLVSWQCKKQIVVVSSTTEAEYVAAANCYGQVLWIQNQLLDYGYNFMNTKIFSDNESTILDIGEGSGQPTDPQHTFTFSQSLNKEQITVPSSSQPKKTYKYRKPRKVIKIPQSSEPTNLVIDEAVYEEMYDRVERAATIATSIDAEELVQVFCTTGEIKKVNGEAKIHALIDGKRIIVYEVIIRSVLQFGDEGGVECLPTSTIFEEIAKMGYEKPS
ncbi:putative ribonuclease H-like domain-containing protein [Tanacetum coccineum]